MMSFMQNVDFKTALFEESPTCKMIKAIHEKSLENLTLAIEQGAQVEIEVIIFIVKQVA